MIGDSTPRGCGATKRYSELFRGPLLDEDGLGDACDPCPNSTDPTCAPTTCLDEDGDGYGVPGASACAAGHPELFDCNDHDASIHPGALCSAHAMSVRRAMGMIAHFC